MARTTPHVEVFRTNILIGKSLHALATKRGKKFGGFGPYVERLIVADMKRKNSIAHRNGRTLKEAV